MIAPQELRDRQQWLVWAFQPNRKNPSGKPVKMPYYINGKPRTGVQGSPEDRAALTNYQAAVDEMSRSMRDRRGVVYDGIGFAFLPGDGLIGIDLDKIVDEAGVVSEQAMGIVQACDSFTEWSPSKKGLHIIVLGETRTNKDNGIGVEVFCGRQYFTFTGDHYSGAPTQVRPIAADVLERLHALIDRAKGKGGEARAAQRAAPPGGAVTDKRAEVESALAVLSPDSGYDEWIQIGMAIQDALGDAGFAVWDYWSSKGSKYAGQADTLSHWKSFKPGGITAATLFGFARDAGWRGGRSQRRKSAPKREEQGDAAQASGGGEPPLDADDGVPPEGRELPVIQWKQGYLRQCVDKAEAAIMASNDPIYQRAGMLVRVIRRDAVSMSKYSREGGMLGFQLIDQPFLVEAFTDAARWEKFDSRKEEWRRINAPEQAAATYLSRAGRWRLPKLLSVISAPTLRPDGTVLQDPGYDAQTSTWYDPGKVVFPRVPEKPTREQADAALASLMKAFGSFPFASDVDKAVLLATALTALIRRSIPHAPLFGFTAPTSSSGKTLLCDLVSIIAHGQRAPAITFPETDEEAAKLSLSSLMEGDPIILFDNVERPLQGAWLCTMLTSEVYRQRLLGRNAMVSVPTSALWLASGNNLVFFGDLRTRSLICRIDAKSEHPERREFAGDIKESLARERVALVVAGLTVMRAFITSGNKVSDLCSTWGRFEHWTNMVRAPLLWLGCADPCDSMKDIERDDPERGELIALLHAWHARFGSEPKAAREAIADSADEGFGQSTEQNLLAAALRDVCKDRGGSLDSRRLGKWLQRHVGRHAEGMQFERAGEKDHTQLYRVVKTTKEGPKPRA